MERQSPRPRMVARPSEERTRKPHGVTPSLTSKALYAYASTGGLTSLKEDQKVTAKAP